jgi:hypothetical protein
MLEYESLRPLFDIGMIVWALDYGKIHVPKVMRATRIVVQITHYVVLSCDEVSIVDNQSCLSLHYYVLENLVRIPILIFLDRVVASSRSDNLSKVTMEALMISLP